MKHLPRLLLVPFLLLASLLLSTGCGEESQPTRPADPVPVRLVISPPSGLLTSSGQSLRLNAALLDANGNTLTGFSIAWSSSNSAVASVSDNGVVIARSAGATQITAAAGGIRTNITVTVAPSPSRIVVTPESARLTAKGETLTLKAVVLDAGGAEIPDAPRTWTSENPEVASVDDQGVVTARMAGETRITVSSGDLSAGVKVTVAVEEETNRLVVSPESVNMTSIGEPAHLVARVLDANDLEIPDPDLTWTSEDPTVATVDDQGVVTAQMNGQTLVTVTWEDLTASVMVAVSQVANRIAVSSNAVHLPAAGDTVTISAMVLDAGGTQIQGAELAWTSENPAVATVDDQGIVTAHMEGQTRITVSSGDLSASVTVTVVVEESVHFVVALPRIVRFAAAGETEALTGAVFDANGNEIPEAEITWTSENPAVATVDDQGLVTARMEGVTRVAATSGGISGYVEVIVGTPTTLVVTTKSVRLTAIGETVYPEVKVLDAFNRVIHVTGEALTFASEDPAVATVDDDGRITARMNGRTVVTVTWEDTSDSISVTVAQEAVDIVVTPGSVRLSAVGETIRLAADVFDANDFQIPGAEVTWSSDNPSVASIDDDGLVTAHKTGEANITVSSASASATVVVSVGEISSDRAALVHFYHATDGPNWKNDTNWLTDEPLGKWHGISVNSTGRVVSIWLFDNDLKGDLPASLASLSHLEVLALSDSLLTGTIPAELGDLESLDRIILTFSKISGPIPSSLGRLSKLTVLDLQANRLTGGIPSSLGDLSNLAYLRLRGNPLGGSIPSSLGRLDKLQRLYLSHAGLTGSIPASFGGLASLKELFMEGNFLTGRIPEGLGRLEDFISLRLTDNAGLAGPLPRTFLDLELVALYLFGTQVCIPTDSAFQEWKLSFHERYALDCAPDQN